MEYTTFTPSINRATDADPQSFEGFYFTGATIKFKNSMICNIMSVYYPNGPHNDNSDWLLNFNINDKNCLILGDFNARSTFWENAQFKTTNSRFVENVLNSKLILLNTGEITRVPDSSHHRPSAIDLSLASSQIAKDCIWNPLDDTLGSDHRPIHNFYRAL